MSTLQIHGQPVWKSQVRAKPATWVQYTPHPVQKPQAWKSPAYAHASHELQALASDLAEIGDVVPDARARFALLAILRDVLAENSIYPSLSSDCEGGLLEWRADDKLIEVHVEDTGEHSFRVRIRRGATLYEGTSSVHLRRHLRDMTALVDSINPNWRALFGDARAVRTA